MVINAKCIIKLFILKPLSKINELKLNRNDADISFAE